MRTFVLNKLVRDKLLIIMRGQSEEVDYKILSDEELLDALANKLREEVSEFDARDPKAIEELADIREVIDQIVKTLAISPKQLETIQRERRKKRGGFKKKIFIKKLVLQDDDPWAEYYASQPERFTELKTDD